MTVSAMSLFQLKKTAIISTKAKSTKPTLSSEPYALQIPYRNVFNNIAALEADTQLLYTIFKQNKTNTNLRNHVLIEMFAFSCVLVLEHYKRYQNSRKIAEYTNYLEEIENYVAGTETNSSKERVNFFRWFLNSIKKEANSLSQMFVKTSVIKDKIGTSNLGRIYWVFCHFMLNETAVLANHQSSLNKLGDWLSKTVGKLLSQPINIDELAQDLNKPNSVLNILSVAFYYGRILIELFILLKHTIGVAEERNPALKIEKLINELEKEGKSITDFKSLNEQWKQSPDKHKAYGPAINAFIASWSLPENKGKEFSVFLQHWKKENQTTAKERFLKEWDKRKWDMLNNAVWGTINLITNYNDLFGIPGPYAFPIVAGVLLFDIWFISLKKKLAQKEYQGTKLDIEKQIDLVKTQIDDAKKSGLSTEQLQQELALLMQKKNVLEDNWDTTKKILNFNKASALILMVSFTASILLGPPALVLACYAIGTFAVAMYASEKQYAGFISCKKKLNAANANGSSVNLKTLQALQKEYKSARKTLITSLIEKTFIPSMLIMTFALSWQIAVVLMAVYIGVKLYQNYQKSQAAKPTEVNRFTLFNPNDSLKSAEQIEDKAEYNAEEKDNSFTGLPTPSFA